MNNVMLSGGLMVQQRQWCNSGNGFVNVSWAQVYLFATPFMAQTHAVKIRPMRDDERSQVRAILRRCFPLAERIIFSWTPDVLVAERNGQLLGAVVLKRFALPHHRTGGSISWLFTAPEARGQQLGQRLVEAGLNCLDQQGCDDILISVEGCNTSSSKLFATRGFGILSPAAQFQRYGLATLLVWAKLSHYFETGYFLWARPAPATPQSSARQWWGTMMANSAIGYLMLWRLGSASAITPFMWLMLPPTFMALLGVRSLGTLLLAARQGIQVQFRAWESGFPLSLAITLAGAGAMYPMPGNVYPTTTQWRYRDWLTHLGPMALAGTLPLLLLMWGVWAIAQMNVSPPFLKAGLTLALWLGKPLVLFDIALPFFPFTCFNGRRLWDWNKIVWALLAAAAIALNIEAITAAIPIH